MTVSRIKLLLIFSILLAAGLALGTVSGFFLKDRLYPQKPARRYLEIRQGGFRYINPLLECEIAGEAMENNELMPFRPEVEKAVAVVINKKWADDISVYFRELNNGPWFSVGPMETYAPASLMKVPLMVAILKEADADPSFLKKQIRFDSDIDYSSVQVFKPLKTLRRGDSYSVAELLHRMIAYSDNNSSMLLEQTANVELLRRTYHDLDIRSPYVPKAEDYISVNNYSSIFRILFNASYLSKQMSEKALGYLAESDFKQGLVGGLPQGVAVAHKFGEWESGDNKEIKELHDCGIVYYPNHPYLLCVMTKGRSFEFLDDAIRNISYVVYEGIRLQHEKRRQ